MKTRRIGAPLPLAFTVVELALPATVDRSNCSSSSPPARLCRRYALLPPLLQLPRRLLRLACWSPGRWLGYRTTADNVAAWWTRANNWDPWCSCRLRTPNADYISYPSTWYSHLADCTLVIMLLVVFESRAAVRGWRSVVRSSIIAYSDLTSGSPQ